MWNANYEDLFLLTRLAWQLLQNNMKGQISDDLSIEKLLSVSAITLDIWK